MPENELTKVEPQVENQPVGRIPHLAVVLIKAEIMQVNSLGQVTNLPLESHQKIISFSGDSVEECRAKVKSFMEQSKNG